MTSALTVRDKNVLSWIEVKYHETRSFPTLITIQSEWPKTFPTFPDLEAWLASPIIKNALNSRGINPHSKLSATQDLSQAQAAAILVVANLSDRRSTPNKLRSLGITLTQWNAWKKQPAFKNFLHSQLTDDFDTSLDRALSGLLKAVDNGNPRALELYLEMTGRQPTENERNFKLAISRIVESVTRHVKDPNVIRAIAEDFEKIEQGLDPTATINQTVWIEGNSQVIIDQAAAHSLGDSI